MKLFVATTAMVATASVLVACSDGQTGAADVAVLRAPASAALQRMTGLSHLPDPVSSSELAASLRRHSPAGAAAASPVAVLVDVDVRRDGSVSDVRVVPHVRDESVTAVMLEPGAGRGQVVEREYAPVYDPAFGPAAVAALRETRFHPALRDGKAVPFTMRMTVEFTPPAASSASSPPAESRR